MAQVSLTSYCDEIRNLLKSGAYDEAMATGRYILQQYPKYVEVYQLLGEACLGRSMFDEAANLFTRVLSVDPENMAARVSLSRVYEAKGDLDAAVQQMREAFDLAPSVAWVRGELARLLQQQLGKEPPKLKLTRQGLGRIYLRGGLYMQAAEEFESLLREDPDLIDVEVSLAEALWRDGQRIRSIEVCQNILNKLPYCFKANLILGDTWVRNDRLDEGEAHLQKVRLVDPEGKWATEFMGDASPIPRISVMIERLSQEVSSGEVEAGPLWLPDIEHETQAAPLLPTVPAAPIGVARVAGPLVSTQGKITGDLGIAGVPERLNAATTETAASEPVEEEPAWFRALKQEAAQQQELSGSIALTPEADSDMGAEEFAARPLHPLIGEPIVEVPSAGESEPIAQPETAEAVKEPDWFRILWEKGLENGQSTAEQLAAAHNGRIEAEEDQLPVWLRDAWIAERMAEAEREEAPPTESQVTLKSTTPVADEEAPIKEATPEQQEAEEPMWLRILRKESLGDEPLPEEGPASIEPLATPTAEHWVSVVAEEAPVWESSESARSVEEDALWKRILRGEETSASTQEPPEVTELDTEDIPEWLRNAAREEGLWEDTEVASGEMGVPSPTAGPVVEAADKASAPDQAEKVATEANWLAILRTEGLAAVILPERPEAAPAEVVTAAPAQPRRVASEKTPAWLRTLQQNATQSQLTREEVEAMAVDEIEATCEPIGYKLAPYVACSELETGPKAGILSSLEASSTEPTTELAPEWLMQLRHEASVAEEGEEGMEQQLTRAAPVEPGELQAQPKVDPLTILGYERIVEANPKDHVARWKLAQVYASVGNHEAAVAQSQKLIEAGEMIGQVIDYLESAIRSGVRNRQIYQLLGDAHFKQGHLESAIEAYREALSYLY